MIDSKIIELSVAYDPIHNEHSQLHDIQSDFLEWIKQKRVEEAKLAKADYSLELLDIFLSHFEGFSLVAEKQTKSQCYIWNGLYYELKPRSWFGRFLRQICKNSNVPKFRYSTGVRDEFYKFVLDEWNLDDELWTKINNYKNVTPFKNGYYFHEEGIFISKEGPRGSLAPNPDYYFTTTIDANYTPTFEDPVKFLKFAKGLIPDENDRKYVLDYLAYCLTANIGWQTHLILTGPGSCGKSEFLLILKYLLPGLTCNLSLDQLLNKKDNKFIGRDIKGKWVNIGNELSNASISATGLGYYKTLITERTVRAEQKGIDGFDVANMMKGVFCLNDTETMVDGMDLPFFSRLKMIPCKIGHTEVILDYMWKIFQEEGDAIASMLVQRDLPKDRCRVGKGNESYERWNNALPSVYRFAKEYLEPAKEKIGMSCEFVREIYNKWCEKYEEFQEMPVKFGKDIHKLGYDKTQYKVSGIRYRAYDVRFTEQAYIEFEIPEIDPYRPVRVEEDHRNQINYYGSN